MSDSPFEQLLDRVKGGDSDAVFELVEVYGPHIERVVRRTIAPKIRTIFDTQDFVQSVWRTILIDREKLDPIDSPQQLVAFLGGIAKNKVINENVRRLDTAKHNMRREQRIDSAETEKGVPAPHQDMPSAVAIAREQLARLMDERTQQDRQIIEMRLEGDTYVEIARRLGVDERTVRRAVRRMAQLVDPD